MAENTSDRKKHHIELAEASQISAMLADKRFNYEPLFGTHGNESDFSCKLFGKTLKFPMWVSSMTGGTEYAAEINKNLAKACNHFGLGMGLGSCRILLEESDNYLKDFAVRQYIGDQPLFANLGIAQIEKILENDGMSSVLKMMERLEADGLIIHVNPLQEWIQPEGDRLKNRPIDTIRTFMKDFSLPLIVKEVGQGMGPESLRALMDLPVVVEFGALGGTNFSQLELARRPDEGNSMKELAFLGHNYQEMLSFISEISNEKNDWPVKGFIASGGIRNFLDGYYAVQSLKAPALYGQASVLLKYARKSYTELQHFIEGEINGYNLANQFLTIK